MSVHHEISKKVNQTVSLVESYKNLDRKREQEISKVLEKAKNGEEYSVEAINKVTEEINQFALKHHLPTRKRVTKQMVLDLVSQN
ncbi:DUF2533 family protein [Ammoniphilus sp. CFH 90114]|uniref:DUF2533 family protein n=1 Tax=Ammoniphilus sp. CFH 90114 TaxID=2493665 RepID=UPI00100F4997|nr:DUF2533 family protein [Ammoniphilus sp. CFH 90114]RXT14796.1 DUF2533 family protein [Ammoniphilus sp. CFH 90114]